MQSVQRFVGNVNEAIINPLIGFLFVLATVYFLWGVMQFIWASRSDGDQEEGKQHMLWGIIGMTLMVSVYGILRIVTSTFGVNCPGC